MKISKGTTAILLIVLVLVIDQMVRSDQNQYDHRSEYPGIQELVFISLLKIPNGLWP
jgi:hypothetical protein